MVDNQLRDNDPPAAKEAYQKLLDAGYSMREAKEKIGAVALTEIYDVMKEKQSYDEKRYTNALAEMVQQSIDFEDTHKIITEWDDWDELVQRGYEVQNQQDEKQMISCWWDAWALFQQIMETAERKMSISEVMESQDYEYPVEAWLQDMEMELGNAGEYEKRLEFCNKVLEMFDWTYDDGNGFRCAVGEELYEAGKKETKIYPNDPCPCGSGKKYKKCCGRR